MTKNRCLRCGTETITQTRHDALRLGWVKVNKKPAAYCCPNCAAEHAAIETAAESIAPRDASEWKKRTERTAENRQTKRQGKEKH